MNCFPVTEHVNEMFRLNCVLQKTHPQHGMRSNWDSEFEADSEPLISFVVSIVERIEKEKPFTIKIDVWIIPTNNP